MKEKWIYVIRKFLVDGGFNESSLTDDKVIEIGCGLFAPVLCNSLNITSEFAYRMYFNALIQISEPPKELMKGVDIELLRAKLNKN